MPANGRFLLDTNIVIALFAKDKKIHEQMAKAKEVFVPTIVIGELYFGAYNSLKFKENILRIDEFTINNTIIGCNSDTAKKYGELKNHLKIKGQPIPENDIWIAAIAQQYSLALVTRDTHFDVLANVKIEAW